MVGRRADGDPKTALRASVRARRRARSAAHRTVAARGLADVVLASAVLQGASRVACYLSLPSEPGTAPLLSGLRDRGCEVLLPVVDGRDLDWAVDDGTGAPGRRGLPEPTGHRLGAAALAECDVVLLPALAVDLSGARLGQGGGYYDRALGALDPRPPLVALVHDDEVLPAGLVPALPHDVRVDHVATPSRWLAL